MLGMRQGVVSLIVFSIFLSFPLGKNSIIEAASGRSLIYRVRSGDNLTTIARKFGVRISDLRRWNKVRGKDTIWIGQRLRIRKGQRRAASTRHPRLRMNAPVRRKQLLRGFRPFGDRRNYGLLYQLRGRSDVNPARSGRVIKVAYLRGFGRYILVDHGAGWISMYSNMDSVNVRTGQQVVRSSTLGRAKGKRLFFLVSYKGRPVNPVKLLRG